MNNIIFPAATYFAGNAIQVATIWTLGQRKEAITSMATTMAMTASFALVIFLLNNARCPEVTESEKFSKYVCGLAPPFINSFVHMDLHTGLYAKLIELGIFTPSKKVATFAYLGITAIDFSQYSIPPLLNYISYAGYIGCEAYIYKYIHGIRQNPQAAPQVPQQQLDLLGDLINEPFTERLRFGRRRLTRN